MSISAHDLLPLLRCPVCSSLLRQPVTLLCGHSVCSTHVTKSHSTTTTLLLAPCPLPDCTQPSPADKDNDVPNIPPSSTVTFVPVPVHQQRSSHDDALSSIPDLRTDVTVSKLAALIRTHAQTSQDGADTDALDDDALDNADVERHPPDSLPPSGSPTPRPPLHPSPSNATSPSRSSSSSRRPRPSSDEDDDVNTPSSRSHPRPLPRPRKRRRRRLTARPASPDATPPCLDKDLGAELTCEICLLLFYRPLTTPCQHTFCSKCLQRSLDHSEQCPLCRHSLAGFAYHHVQPCNKLVLSILLKAFPESYAERGRTIEQEEHDARLDTPIFVCQLSFPGMPTLLHFFEPRYRLMLRRCLESPTPRFGMIMPPRPTPHGPGNDFGTMLEIRSVRMLPDGRSMVETRGTHRFRVLERGALDGYMVGRVERIDDMPDALDPDSDEAATAVPLPVSADERAASSGSESDGVVTADADADADADALALPVPVPPPDQHAPDELLSICHAFLDQLRQGAAPWVVQRLNHTYGPMPADAADFSFWMAMLLPIDEYEKAKLLPIVSPRLRLRVVVYWIEQLNSNWWFTSGCVIS